ncbi:hypothetical protein AVEN_96028-1 [Araneus ventricosus]|uniref:Uncharacterized protein n=1 Tax=Araneus ventricosus TaxID=182803 RepID=A0A4Y2B5R2_ARAVE|nr:hypothetical protein AVEN_96028-1 [Araneus ventricosus]
MCHLYTTKRNGSTPSLPWHPSRLNDSSSNSSSTEVGVLVAYHRVTARSLPLEVRTITGGGTQSPTIIISTREESSCLLIRQQLISVHPPRGRGVYRTEHHFMPLRQ